VLVGVAALDIAERELRIELERGVEVGDGAVVLLSLLQEKATVVECRGALPGLEIAPLQELAAGCNGPRIGVVGMKSEFPFVLRRGPCGQGGYQGAEHEADWQATTHRITGSSRQEACAAS
jgi:hypothetical protein